MRKNLYLALAIISAPLATLGQADCTGGRFSNYAFAPDVTRTQAITFGSNTAVSGGNQVLKLDVYEPTGDMGTGRPVVFVAFGGSFIGGTRNDGYVVDLCNRFARLGYVAVAMDYRVGFFFPINEVNTTLAVMRGMHDYRGAIRYMRKTAAEDGNPYRIDTERFYVGGVSAGAISAIHAAYLNQMSEIPSYMANDTAGLGGIEGNSGNLGYPSNVQGVWSMSGTIGDTSWIEVDDVPILSLHETGDNTVPIGTQEVAVSGFPTGLIASGSRDIHARADNQGVENCFREYNQNNHVGYLDYDYNSALGYVVSFLEDLACGQAIECGENTFVPGTGIAEHDLSGSMTLSPSVTNGNLTIDLSGAFAQWFEYDVIDAQGRILLSGQLTSARTNLDMSQLPAGVYMVRAQNASGRAVGRFVRE